VDGKKIGEDEFKEVILTHAGMRNLMKTRTEDDKMVDETRLNQFIGRMLDDLGGALSISLVRIGDRLGLYQALHTDGPMRGGCPPLGEATVTVAPASRKV